MIEGDNRYFSFVNLKGNFIMITVTGTYQNGYVQLEREYSSDKPVKVVITFLEEIEPSSDNGFSLSDFSFASSRKALENYPGSFSKSLIEERRNDL